MRISEIPQGRSSSPLGCAINEGPGPPARGVCGPCRAVKGAFGGAARWASPTLDCSTRPWTWLAIGRPLRCGARPQFSAARVGSQGEQVWGDPEQGGEFQRALSTHGYYLHVPFEETVARHVTKPIADEVGEAELRDWYRELDLLPGGTETVIFADSALPETVDRILLDTGLAALPALEG